MEARTANGRMLNAGGGPPSAASAVTAGAGWHAAAAAGTPTGVSASPVPPTQPHYLSSLSINTGSSFAFLHGNGMTGAMPSPASSPFRTPSGLPSAAAAAAVRHHWSHTPPPIDTYGRYGLGHSLYSLFPMMTGAVEAGPYCMQPSATAARYIHKTNPYHHLLDPTRDLGLYHPHPHHYHQQHAGLPLGSPYSPTLSIDPLELASPSSSSLDMERTTGTPHEFAACKSIGGMHDCTPNFWKRNSPSCCDNSPTMTPAVSTTAIAFGGGCYNCQTCGDAADRPPTAKSSDQSRRLNYGNNRTVMSRQDGVQEAKVHQRLSTSIPVSQKLKDVRSNSVGGGKTVLSPPKATAPTLPCSQKLIGSDVAPIFKGATAPTTTILPKTYESGNVQRSTFHQTRPTAKQKSSEEVKTICSNENSEKVTCNSDDRSAVARHGCSEAAPVKSASAEPATAKLKTPVASSSSEDNVQFHVLNLSQNSDDDQKFDPSSEQRGTDASNSDVDVDLESNQEECDNVEAQKFPAEVPTKDDLVVCDNDSCVRVKQEAVAACHTQDFRTVPATSTTTTVSSSTCTKSAISSSAATFWSSVSSFSSANNKNGVHLKPLEVTEKGFRSAADSSTVSHVKDSRQLIGGSNNRERRRLSPNIANSVKRIEAIVTSIASSRMNTNYNNNLAMLTATAKNHSNSAAVVVTADSKMLTGEISLKSKEHLSGGGLPSLQTGDSTLAHHQHIEKLGAEQRIMTALLPTGPPPPNATDVGILARPIEYSKIDKGLDLTKSCCLAIETTFSSGHPQDPAQQNRVVNLSRSPARSNHDPEKRCKSVATKSPQMSPKFRVSSSPSSSTPTLSSSSSSTRINSSMQNVYQSHPGHLPWSWDNALPPPPPPSNIMSQNTHSDRHLRPLPILEVSGSRSIGTVPTLPFHGIHSHSAGKMEAPTLLHHHHYDWLQQSMPIPYDLSVNSSMKLATGSVTAATTTTTNIFSTTSMSQKMSPLTISTGSPMQSPLKECLTGSEVPTLLLCSSSSNSGAEYTKSVFEVDRFKSMEYSSMERTTSNRKATMSMDAQSAVSTVSPRKGAEVSDVGALLHPHGKSTAFPVMATKTENNSSTDQIVLKQFTTGTSTIPVGIAVARLRQESHSGNSAVKQKVSKELRKVTSAEAPLASSGVRCGPNEDFLRNPRQILTRREKSVSTRHTTPAIDFEANMLMAGGSSNNVSTSWAENGAKVGTSFQTRWLPTSTHGHSVGPQALWLGQNPYATTPTTLPVQLSTLENSARQLPPLGYQLARDPISSHFFLIPATNIDLMDRAFLWQNYTNPPSATPTSQIPPAHANHFQQYVYQQQQEQLLQQKQRASDLRLKQHESKSLNVSDKMEDVTSSVDSGDVGLDLSLSESIVVPLVKEKINRKEVLIEKSSSSSLSTIHHSSSSAVVPLTAASLPTVTRQSYPYAFSTDSVNNGVNPMPYYYDHRVSTAPADDLHVNVDADTRCRGTSPVSSSVDICLTPPSDCKDSPPSTLTALDEVDELADFDKTSVHVDVVGMGDADDENAIKSEPLMTDACNQTETPPLTDDEGEDDEDEEEEEDDDDAEGDDESGTHKIVSDDLVESLLVKQEDSGIQCDLLSVKSCDFSSTSSMCEFSASAEKKLHGASTAVTGLELLSNTIMEHEESHCSSAYNIPTSVSASIDVPSGDSNFLAATEKLEACVQSGCAEENKSASSALLQESSKLSTADDTASHQPAPCKSDSSIDVIKKTPSESQSLGGLSLLCALAEQRILQETNSPAEVAKPPSAICEQDNDEVAAGADDNSKVDSNQRSYKISKIQKEYKEFIAHKMLQYSQLPDANKCAADESSVSVVGMDAAEFEMRMRLAELQKKYKEKQKELARLLPKKDHLAEKGFSKRGPGRPRKRKLLALYKSKVAAKFTSTTFQSLVNNSKSNRSSSSRRDYVCSFKDNFMKSGRQILKPSLLMGDSKSASSASLLIGAPTWTTASSSSESSPAKTPAFQPSFCPLTMGALSFGKSPSSMFSESSGAKTQQRKIKDSPLTEAAESSSDITDSDDSNSGSRRKRTGKRGSAMREAMSKRAKRKICRLGRLDCDDEDSLDLSVSFSSLSVSCTMPPFQGCEESTGLGLLAKYASQVVEQAESAGEGIACGDGAVGEGSEPRATCCEGVNEDDEEADCGDGQGKDCSPTARKRKPGRPKKHSPSCTEQDTAECNLIKKAKPVSFLKLDSPVCMPKSKHSVKEAGTPASSTARRTLSETKHPSFLEDEAWLRRRSERIFLNEPSINPKSFLSSWSSSHELRSSGHCSNLFSTWKQDEQIKLDTNAAKPKKRTIKGKPDIEPVVKKSKPLISKPSKEVPATKSALIITLPQSVSGQNANGTRFVEDEGSGGQKKLEDSDPESPGNSSFSEGDNLPLIQLIERPTTPEPRSCVIRPEELRDSLRVLTMMDGLFYAGYINAIRAPDVYGIIVDGERGNRPHIYSREEILKEAILEVKAMSMRYLAAGTRVCTYWSQQYRCLYPGTVSTPTSPCSSPDHGDQNNVYVEFDDGDSGRIPLCNIRLLPPDLPIISYEPDPLIVGKRRRKSTGDISREKQSLVSLNEPTSKSLDIQILPLESISSTQPANNVTRTKSASPPVTFKASTIVTVTSPEKESEKSKEVALAICATKSRITPALLPTSTESRVSTKCSFTLTTATTKTKSPPPSFASGMAPFKTATRTTITPAASITVIAIGGRPNPNSSATDDDSSSTLNKWKKHKKHRSHDRIDDRRHHHHHHHHHHRHKHRHDRFAAGNNRTFKAPPISKVASASAGADIATTITAASTEGDAKKPELTLKIKTGNHVAEAGECEETTKADTVCVKSVISGSGSSQSDDRDSSSQSSCSESCDDTAAIVEQSEAKSTQKPPLTSKAKTTKEESSTNDGGGAASSSQKTAPKANKKGKDKAANVESKSKMAAFLPARQLWKWSGKGFKRPTRGKAKKEFYKSITRGKELIRVGDSAVFLSTGRPHLPYIGRIETMWESWGGNMVVKVKWFYHPEETKGGRRLTDTKGALYQSLHEDENDVQTISHKCEVLKWSEYSEHRQREALGTQHVSKYGGSPFDNNDVYYLAGTYDPLTGQVTLEPGVS